MGFELPRIETPQVLKDTVKVVTNPGQALDEAGKTVEKTAQNLGKEGERGIQNIGKETEKGIQSIGKEAEKGVQNLGKEGEKAGQNIGKEGEIAIQNFGREAEIAFRNIKDESERTKDNVDEAFTASYNFFDNQLSALGTSVDNAKKRAMEGKWLDAVWHLSTEPLQAAEENAGKAVMESSLLNNLAAVTAGATGGPAASAAYASWVAYKVTGSLDVALKAGAIAFACAQGYQSIGDMPNEAWDDAAKKILASSAMSGAAIAASGGSDEDVLNAFKRGAITDACRAVYRDVVQRDPTGKIAIKEGVAKLPIKETDPEQYKVIAVDPEINHVGIAVAKVDNGYIGITETAGVMEDLSKIPLMNDMAIFHDKWMEIANVEGPAVQMTILPAIAVTGAASQAAAVTPSTDKIIEKEKEKERTAQT